MLMRYNIFKIIAPSCVNNYYVTRFDKFQYIVPDWQYTRYYYFSVEIRNCRVAIEDWTAAMATKVS